MFIKDLQRRGVCVCVWPTVWWLAESEERQNRSVVMLRTLITRTGPCPGLLSTDVAASPRLLFLPPIKSTSLIGVCEVHRHSCMTECFRFPHIVVCRCTAAFHSCSSYRKIPKLHLGLSEWQSWQSAVTDTRQWIMTCNGFLSVSSCG